jgi:hypothetical protein
VFRLLYTDWGGDGVSARAVRDQPLDSLHAAIAHPFEINIA